MLQSEETTSTISAMKARITSRLNPTAVARTTSHATSPPPTTDHHESRVTRLSKLELPQFCSDPLTWQSFWDCFKASIHTNENLTGVQKLSYLRSQLQGEASHVIAGFPLTSTNHQHSITLLQECFGQPHKQIDAHMQALIDLSCPSATLANFMTLLKGTHAVWPHLGNHETAMVACLSPSFLGNSQPRSNKTKPEHMVGKHGILMNSKRPFLMRFTSLRQDHRLILMLPHYRQLHRFTWVLPIDLF